MPLDRPFQRRILEEVTSVLISDLPPRSVLHLTCADRFLSLSVLDPKTVVLIEHGLQRSIVAEIVGLLPLDQPHAGLGWAISVGDGFGAKTRSGECLLAPPIVSMRLILP